MGGKTSVSSSGVTIPPEVLARYNSVNKNADIAAGHNFNNYSTTPQAGGANGQFVAPMNAQENRGISGVNSYANAAQPYFGAATNTLQGAYANTQPINNYALMGTAQNAAPIGGEQINRYMSPYLNTVLGSESALLNQNNQQQQAGQMGTAIRSGAFGGDRSGIAAANLNQQQNLANANIYGNILNQGYGQALSTAQQQQQIGLAGANQFANIGNLGFQQGAGTSQQLAALGMGSQQAGLQGAQAQIGAGQLQQQTAQAENTALYNQFLQQQSYPFQIANFLAGIAEGTGALSGSTTTGQQPGGFFSDERLKHDAEVIGKTFDGQPIYKYKYKGDDRTQIGLMAQDVEHKHPEAVGLAAGYKTVDYDKATKHAAERGHFYEGGLVPQSMGGHVGEEHMGEGYERGGYATRGGVNPLVDSNDLEAYMNAGQPVGLGGLYGAQTIGNIPHASGAEGYVPSVQMPVGKLMTAALPTPLPSGLDQAEKIANIASKVQQARTDWRKESARSDAMKAKKSQDANANRISSGIDAEREAGYAAPPAPADSSGAEEQSYQNSVGPLNEYRGGVAGHMNYAYGGFAPGGLADNSVDPVQTEAEDPYTQKTHGLKIEAKENTDKLDPAKLPTPGPSGLDNLSKVASIVGTAAMFSDARLKHDAEVIGKTFDGQPIYKYKYKGDDKTQIGLMAQNVEHSHPNAVGLAGGYKTVDYDKATKHSAERGHFYEGGLAGGRHGYAVDGEVDDESTTTANPKPTGVAPVVANDKKDIFDERAADQEDKPWYKRPEGITSILAAIGGMGMAPTRSLGTALATGLTAGARNYMPAASAAADISASQASTRGMNISNALKQMKGRYAKKYMELYQGGPKIEVPQDQTALDVPPQGTDPTSYYRNQYFVNTAYTPNELAQYNAAQVASDPEILGEAPVRIATRAHENRVVNDQSIARNKAQRASDMYSNIATANEHGVSAYDLLNSISPDHASAIAQELNNQNPKLDPSNPASWSKEERQLADSEAARFGEIGFNATHPWTGDVIDRNGAWTNKRTGKAPIGDAAQRLSPDQVKSALEDARTFIPFIDSNGSQRQIMKWQASGFASDLAYARSMFPQATTAGAQLKQSNTAAMPPAPVAGAPSPKQATITVPTPATRPAAAPAAPAAAIAPARQPAPGLGAAAAPAAANAGVAGVTAKTPADRLKTALSDQSFMRPQPAYSGNASPGTVQRGEQEALVTQRAKLRSDSATAATAATQALAYYEAAEAVLRQKGVPTTGRIGQFLNDLSKTVGGQGKFDNSNYQEIAKYLANAATQNLRSTFPNLSQGEVQLALTDLNPSMGNNPKALLDLMSSNKKQAEYTLKSAGRAARYADTALDPVKFPEWENKYYNRSIGTAIKPIPINSQEEYDQLEPNQEYLTPDGKKARHP